MSLQTCLDLLRQARSAFREAGQPLLVDEVNQIIRDVEEEQRYLALYPGFIEEEQ